MDLGLDLSWSPMLLADRDVDRVIGIARPVVALEFDQFAGCSAFGCNLAAAAAVVVVVGVAAFVAVLVVAVVAASAFLVHCSDVGDHDLAGHYVHHLVRLCHGQDHLDFGVLFRHSASTEAVAIVILAGLEVRSVMAIHLVHGRACGVSPVHWLPDHSMVDHHGYH